jgi:hypothetical protein
MPSIPLLALLICLSLAGSATAAEAADDGFVHRIDQLVGCWTIEESYAGRQDGDPTAVGLMVVGADGVCAHRSYFTTASGMAPIATGSSRLETAGERWQYLGIPDPRVEPLLDQRFFNHDPVPRAFQRDGERLRELWPLPPGMAGQPGDVPGFLTVARWRLTPGEPAAVIAGLDAAYPGTPIAEADLFGRWRVEKCPKPRGEGQPSLKWMEFRTGGTWTLSWGDAAMDPPAPTEFFVRDGRLVLLVPFVGRQAVTTTVGPKGRSEQPTTDCAKRGERAGCAIAGRRMTLWLPSDGLFELRRD